VKRSYSLITLVIVIGLIVVLVGSLRPGGPDPAQFSATITGDITKSLSFNMQGDTISLASGSRPSMGQLQLLGLTSQNNRVIVTLGYPGSEMPVPGPYIIRGEPAEGSFFGGVLVFPDTGEVTSLSDALTSGNGTVQYTATSGTILFEKINDVYRGRFNFAATSPTSQKPIQVTATFSNVRENTAP
jgi:hypothetical protein